MQVVNVKKKYLNLSGYRYFAEWALRSEHMYIGRNMNFYVNGAFGSKWQNPYQAKKYGLNKCLELYEAYIRNGKLYDQLEELDGKVLGCWCYPDVCHGDVLCRLLREKKEKKIFN